VAILPNPHEAAQPGRAGKGEIARTPDPQRDILHHQHDAEGGEQLEKFRRAVDPAQQGYFQ